MIKIYVLHVPKKCKLVLHIKIRTFCFTNPQICVITLFLPSEVEIESSTDFNILNTNE